MTLTDQNYYSVEASNAYMSVSQLRRWGECEAATLAMLQGKHAFPRTKEMNIGNYVDCALTEPDRLEAWKLEHPEMIAKSGENKGGLLKTYIIADKCVARVQREELAMNLLTHSNQEILTGVIGGVMWKGKLDAVRHDIRKFGDLKTAKDFAEEWDSDSRKYRPWWWKYLLQLAIYRELLYQKTGEWYDPCILGVAKHDKPAMCWPYFDASWTPRFAALTEFAGEAAQVYTAIKNGEAEARFCKDSKCGWCADHRPFEPEIVSYEEAS